jgi:hypothetical protein
MSIYKGNYSMSSNENYGNEIWPTYQHDQMNAFQYQNRIYSNEFYPTINQNKRLRSNNFGNLNQNAEIKEYLEYNSNNSHLAQQSFSCSISDSSNASFSEINTSFSFESKPIQSSSLKNKQKRLIANERERNRMHNLNKAFEKLRSVLPTLSSNKQYKNFFSNNV